MRGTQRKCSRAAAAATCCNKAAAQRSARQFPLLYKCALLISDTILKPTLAKRPFLTAMTGFRNSVGYRRSSRLWLPPTSAPNTLTDLGECSKPRSSDEHSPCSQEACGRMRSQSGLQGGLCSGLGQIIVTLTLFIGGTTGNYAIWENLKARGRLPPYISAGPTHVPCSAWGAPCPKGTCRTAAAKGPPPGTAFSRTAAKITCYLLCHEA